MSHGLFIPSGARVPLVGLPPIDPPLRLADGRALRCVHIGTEPMGDVSVPWQMWSGPDGLKCMVSMDPTDAWGPLLHASVSYEDVRKQPSWADLTAIKDALFGDVDACMVLPKREDYVNVRANCFHLWQTPERWGIR